MRYFEEPNRASNPAHLAHLGHVSANAGNKPAKKQFLLYLSTNCRQGMEILSTGRVWGYVSPPFKGESIPLTYEIRDNRRYQATLPVSISQFFCEFSSLRIGRIPNLARQHLSGVTTQTTLSEHDVFIGLVHITIFFCGG
jgi:hypothetical protein